MERKYKPKHTSLDKLHSKARKRRAGTVAGTLAAAFLAAPTATAVAETIDQYQNNETVSVSSDISSTFTIPESIPEHDNYDDDSVDSNDQPEKPAPEQDPTGFLDQVSEINTSQVESRTVDDEEGLDSTEAVDDFGVETEPSEGVEDNKSAETGHSIDQPKAIPESSDEFDIEDAETTASDESQDDQNDPNPEVDNQTKATEETVEPEGENLKDSSKNNQNEADTEPSVVPETNPEQEEADSGQASSGDDEIVPESSSDESEVEETKEDGDIEADLWGLALTNVDVSDEPSAEDKPDGEADQSVELEDDPVEDEAEEDTDIEADLWGFAIPAEEETGAGSEAEASEEGTDTEDDLWGFAVTPEATNSEDEVPDEEDAPAEEEPAVRDDESQAETPDDSESGQEEEPKKSVSEIADEVIAGKWGKDQERIDKITAAGYDYNEVQKEVNRRFEGGSILTQTVTKQEAKDLCAQAGVEYVGPEQGWKDGVPHPIYICKLPDSVTYDHDSNNPRYANVLIVNQLVAALDEIRAEGIDIEVNSAFRSADRQRELRKEHGCYSDYGRDGCDIQIGGVGYSNHNSAIAVDVYSSVGYTGKVREIFNKHGFTNTVPDDLIHFEYANPTVDVPHIIEHGYASTP